jgi:hypothetical protein
MDHSKRAAARQPRPLPRGDSLFTPGASSARRNLERRAAAPLLFLHQLPMWVAPAVMVVLLVIGLAIRGVVGAVALFAVAIVLTLLGLVSWPQLTVRGRVGRALAICAVLALAGWQATR